VLGTEKSQAEEMRLRGEMESLPSSRGRNAPTRPTPALPGTNIILGEKSHRQKSIPA